MLQVKDHVCPGFDMCVPSICVLLSTLFQERVSYFTIYMMLLQKTTSNMRINILKTSDLAKSKKLEVGKVILNNI
jgi:hypothetical protein